jgi:hypothetical protein
MNNTSRATQLENWIQGIRKNDNYYCFDTWKYRLSGTVLELSVIPANTRNRNIYRCSAITIGQILKTLSSRIENEGLHFHIQSFPNIENPEIIAAIRMDENSYHLPEVFPKIENSEKLKTFREWLLHLSDNYQFKLEPTQKPEHFASAFITNHPVAWYALTSISDNPFTWLNLGYWKETILTEAKKIFPETDLIIHDFCKYRDDSLNQMDKSTGSILQAYITFTL